MKRQQERVVTALSTHPIGLNQRERPAAKGAGRRQGGDERQDDLFDSPRWSPGESSGELSGNAAPGPARGGGLLDVEDWSDAAIVDALPQAGLSELGPLCEAVISRTLDEAVPALRDIWRRMTGFGWNRPLPEQRHVIATIDGLLASRAAAQLLTEIILLPTFPPPLLADALQAAQRKSLSLPASVLIGWIRDGDPAVRRTALVLAAGATRPDAAFVACLTAAVQDFDRDARKAAAVALGGLGQGIAREVLLMELRRAPDRPVIAALASIENNDDLVLLGRVAREHADLKTFVIELLEDIDSEQATRIATRLKGAG